MTGPDANQHDAHTHPNQVLFRERFRQFAQLVGESARPRSVSSTSCRASTCTSGSRTSATTTGVG